MSNKSEHSVELKPQESYHENVADERVAAPAVAKANNYFGSKKRVAALLKESEEMYAESSEKFGPDSIIDPELEKKLIRKIDWRLLPILGISYAFYYIDKTTLSYAAIFGIRESKAKGGLGLVGTEYSWLSSIFYFGWLAWAIPSNLLMQKSPPAWYLGFNIFMWGVLLMAQAAAQNFAALAALRVLSGAAEAIADPAFMLFTTIYYTRAEQPSRISAWYMFNGVGVAGGGLIGYGIGQIKGALSSWRYEFIIVGAACAVWGLVIFFYVPNSPVTSKNWFTRDERLMIIARARRNQTGLDSTGIKWYQIREAALDWKTYTFFMLGFIGNIPNGGISNFSTLVIKGLGFDTFETALLGIPQGALVVIWIGLGALLNGRLPANSRTLVCMLFMLPTIGGSLGFLLAPTNAYAGRLVCFYLTGSYQASFVLALSLITSNIGGMTKRMIISGIIWFGACVGNIASPFFYKTEQAPKYQLGIGSILVANCIEFGIFVLLRFGFIWENKRKERLNAERIARGEPADTRDLSFLDLTDRENPNFRYVY